VRQEARTRPDVPTILTARSPTVTLTRVQSGVGTLLFESVTAPSIGDVRLGCAYQLQSGRSSTVQHSAGRSTAPPGETRRPIVLAGRQYIIEALASAQSMGPYVRINDWMRPAVARGFWLANAAAAVILAVGFFALRQATRSRRT